MSPQKYVLKFCGQHWGPNSGRCAKCSSGVLELAVLARYSPKSPKVEELTKSIRRIKK